MFAFCEFVRFCVSGVVLVVVLVLYLCVCLVCVGFNSVGL